MELKVLLKDDVFVDFFNTFLNLPVFGQTPLFLPSENKWLMCPSPHLLQVNTGVFLKWLETHRLVFFKQTELYHSFILCKEILGFVASDSTEELKWTLADQRLVKRCLCSVMGIQRFRSFLKGTAGEELFLFCVRVSVLLNMEEEFQTFDQQSYLTTIRLCHLSEGSAILSLCHLHKDDITELLSNESARNHMLPEMRLKALRRLQSYWLPQFLHTCKSCMWRVPECRPIVEEYMSASSPSPAGQLSSPQERDECESYTLLSSDESYCSKHTKRRLWDRHRPNTDYHHHVLLHSICLWLPSEGSECLNISHSRRKACRNLVTLPTQINFTDQERDALDHHAPPSTPMCQFPCCVNIQVPPSDAHCYLRSALTAEGRAGRPFRTFLRAQGLMGEVQMLGLWQDLDLFLQIFLKSQGEDPLYAQRQNVARRIIETYLSEFMPCYVPLDPNTSRHLRSLLPSNTAVPWIYVAKYEICQKLCDVYDSFLDAEDNTLLSDLTSQGEECEDSEQSQFSGFEMESEAHFTQMEALLLSERCCSYGNPDDLSHENWALVAQQDLQRGGSLLLKKIRIDPDPDLGNSTLATQNMSDNEKPFTQGVPVSKPVGLQQRKTDKKEIIQRPPKPRTFDDVFATPLNIDDFKCFLQSFDAEEPLKFILEAKSLRIITAKQQKAKILSIVDKFFRGEDPMDTLQCNADIITSVSQMDVVTPEVIFTVQHLVAKSLEALWYSDDAEACQRNIFIAHMLLFHSSGDLKGQFTKKVCHHPRVVSNLFRQYQETFAPSPASSDVNLRAVMLMEKLKKNVWEVFSCYIRCVLKFVCAVKDREMQDEFEWYLVKGYEHFSEPCKVKSRPQHILDISDDGDSFKPRIRSIINKTVIVNFLPNDLCFYLECERFRHLADVGDKLASEGMYSETDYVMLCQKAQLIINIFMQCNTSPKLRINITEAHRDGILQEFNSGKVDRTLFYPAMMDVFPIIIYCWKKFRSLKTIMQLCGIHTLKDRFESSIPECPVNIQSQQIQTVTSTEVKEPTLRFSAQHGLILLLPETSHLDASHKRFVKIL